MNIFIIILIMIIN